MHVSMAYRLPIAWRDPLDAFRPFADEPWAMLRLGQGTVRFGLAPSRTVLWTDGTPDPFEAVRRTIDPCTTGQNREFEGGWSGLVGYEFSRSVLPRLEGGPVRGAWPDLALGYYEAVAVFDLVRRKAWIGAASPGGASAARALKRRLDSPPPGSGSPLPASLDLFYAPNMPDAAAFRQRVERVVDYIRAGDCLQANISQALPFTAPAGPFVLFAALARDRPARFCCYFRLPGGGGADALALVSNSPERFLRVRRRRDGRLRAVCEPIKGTRPRDPDALRDRAQAIALLGSVKDGAENLMITDLVRNDLARVSLPGTVVVEELCALREFAHQHHLVSTVSSVLAPGTDALHLLAACFPGGSVTGAPKIRAMQIIAEMEAAPRGPYCGSMIWLGPDGSMDSSILIRTAALARRHGVWEGTMRVGGGIVADSSPDSEHAETLVKARDLFGPGFGAAGG